MPRAVESKIGGLALYSVRLPANVQTELAARFGRYIGEVPSIRWKCEWNPSQLIDTHTRRHGYGSHLGNLDRPLANNVAAQHLRGLAVDDELAEASLPPIDDRA